MFENRKLLIATKHSKENMIAPLFEQELGVSCFVSDKFDTDILGTFSGEVPREDNALNTLRNKCLLALEYNNCDLVIASEGSFGAHPFLFFGSADDELMMLIDLKNDLEIVVREIGMETNFNATTLIDETELIAFAEKVNFPSHGLILKPSESNYEKVIKGIKDFDSLKQHFQSMINQYGSVYVETDMRANFNPTRMNVIKKTAQKLLQTVKSQCPNCKTPGFAVTKVLQGLPCGLCNTPTASTLSHLYVCKKCDFTKEFMYPLQKTKEDPTYCDFCNP